MRFGLDLLSTRTGSAFRRNFLLVLRANVLAQIVALLSAPVLSRLYATSDFGKFAVFSSVAGLAIAVSTGRFDWLVPNSPNMLAASTLMVLGFAVVLCTSIMAFVACLSALLTHAPVLDGTGLGATILLLPVVMLGAGLVEMFNGWFVRSNELQAVSRSKMAQSYANAGVSVAGGVLGMGASGLIFAFVALKWTGVTTLARNATQFWPRLNRVTVRRLKAAFLRNRREAGWSTLVSLVNAANSSATIFILASFFGLREVGWYTFMLRIAAGPIGLIASSMGQSFWSAAAEKARAGQFAELRQLYLRTTRRLALLTIPILIGCSAGPFIVGPLFGKAQWGEAGTVLLAMAPMLIGTAVFSPTNHLVVYNRQAYQLFSDIFSIILSFLVVYASVRLHLGFAISVFLMSIAVLVSYAIRFCLHLRVNTEAARGSGPV